VDGVKPNEEKWDEMDGWREEPCKAGTLVLIHGEPAHPLPELLLIGYRECDASIPSESVQ